MIGRLGAVAAIWGAAAGLGHCVGGAAAFVATLLVPGWALERILRLTSTLEPHPLERLARWLTYSVALAGIFGLLAYAAGSGIAPILCGLLATSIAGCFGQDRPRDLASTSGLSRASAGAVLMTVVLVLTVVAAYWPNLARDRTWYLAYLVRLASGAPLVWTEPFFGSDHVVARFAHNAWLVGLAASSALAGATPALLFERVAPVMLVPCVAGAALAASRTVLGAGAPAAVGALASLAILALTRFPFFSPERYPFFGRLAEDKTLALLVLAPVTLALAIDGLSEPATRSRRTAIAVAVAGFAVGATHALVYLLLLVTLAVGFGWLVLCSRTLALRRALLVFALFALALPLPAAVGRSARSQMSVVDRSAEASDLTHPVLRSHLRIGRVVGIEQDAAPVADPELVAHPLLVVALAGLAPAALAWRTVSGAFLLPVSLAFLAIAFVPVLAQGFGQLVLPWMTYRALWGVPFGLLLGLLLLEIPKRLERSAARARTATTACAWLLGALVLAGQPWRPLLSGAAAEAARRVAPDAETRDLLDAIGRLPAGSRIAAAAALAELVPGSSSRQTLAFSDRGTVVFAGSRTAAEDRMQANAALVGLNGHSRRLRNRIVGAFGITHTVYAEEPCDRGSREIFRSARYVLCAEGVRAARPFVMRRRAAAAAPTATGTVVASLRAGLSCEPAADRHREDGLLRWERRSRWSGQPLRIDCAAYLSAPTRASRLRIELHAPRAHEALVYRMEARTADGTAVRRRGVLEFRGSGSGEIPLPAEELTELRLRLLPAYLPYLHLREIELRS